MPFTPQDAAKHTKKATSPKQKRQWAHVANSALKRGLSERKAIASANSVVSSSKGK
jgi:uncharacterized protein YdaT